VYMVVDSIVYSRMLVALTARYGSSSSCPDISVGLLFYVDTSHFEISVPLDSFLAHVAYRFLSLLSVYFLSCVSYRRIYRT